MLKDKNIKPKIDNTQHNGKRRWVSNRNLIAEHIVGQVQQTDSKVIKKGDMTR